MSPKGSSLCAQAAAARAQELDSTVGSFNCMGPLWDTKFKPNLSQAAPVFFCCFLTECSDMISLGFKFRFSAEEDICNGSRMDLTQYIVILLLSTLRSRTF